jgi:hypothetical protein
MEVLEFLSRRAADPKERASLATLASDYNAYNEWRQGWPGAYSQICMYIVWKKTFLSFRFVAIIHLFHY